VLLAHLIESLLFGITPTDLPTFFIATISLMLVAIAACWLPARYATKVDPAVAIRSD